MKLMGNGKNIYMKKIDRKKKYEIQSKLNELRLYGVEDLKIGDLLLLWCDAHLYENYSIKSVINIIYKIIQSIYLDRYSYTINGNGLTLLFFSNSAKGRQDHFYSFTKIKSLLNDYLFVYPETKKKYELNICLLKKYIIWWFQIKKIKEPFILRLIILWGLAGCSGDFYNVNNYIRKNKIDIENIIVLFDVFEIDSFFVQMMKKKGIKTITLQHGVYEYDSYAFKYSKSDYFFAWNENERLKGISCGIDSDKIIVTGILPTIGIKKSKNFINSNIKKIGIILSSEDIYNASNVMMLEGVGKYAKKNHISVIVKYHPSSNQFSYRDLMEKYDYEKSNTNDINLFLNDVDMCILVYSSALLSVAFHDKPFLICDDGMEYKDYKCLEEYKYIRFSKVNEIDKLLISIEQGKYDNIYQLLRKKLIPDGDVADNYKYAFNRIGIK